MGVADEIDAHYDAIRREREGSARLREWASRYDPFSSLNPMDSVTSPHRDLLMNFVTRAKASNLGSSGWIAKGPDGGAYWFKERETPWLFYRHELGFLKRAGRLGFSQHVSSWSMNLALRRAKEALEREATSAIELQLGTGSWDLKSTYVNVSVVVAGGVLYADPSHAKHSLVWGERDNFAKACAEALSGKP